MFFGKTFSVWFFGAALAVAAQPTFREVEEVAESYLREGNLGAALDVYQDMFETHQGNADIWVNMANILVDMGNDITAKQLLRDCNEYFGDAEEGLHCLLALCGEYLRSESLAGFKYCKKAYEMQPKSVFTVTQYLVALDMANEVEEAVKLADIVTEDYSYDSMGVQNAYMAYLHAGLCEKVEKMATLPAEYLHNVCLYYALCDAKNRRGTEICRAGNRDAVESRQLFGCSEMTFEPDMVPDSFVTLEKGGGIYGYEHVKTYPQVEDCALQFKEKRIDLAYMKDVTLTGNNNGIIPIKRGDPCKVFLYNHDTTQVMQVTLNELPNRHIDSCVMSVADSFPHNYYHVALETASKLLIMKENRHLVNCSNPKYLVSGSVKGGLVEQILPLLGIREDEVIFFNSGKESISVDEFYYVSWYYDEPLEDKYFDSWVSVYVPPSALKRVQNALAPVRRFTKDDWKIVFLTRHDQQSRCFEPNSTLIEDAMKKRFGDRVAIVEAGDYSLKYQIELMRNAAVVVGPHGAALTNIVWAPEDATLVVMPMKPESDVCFAATASAIGADYVEVSSMTAHYFGDYHTTETNVADVVEVVQRIVSEKGLNMEAPKQREFEKEIEAHLKKGEHEEAMTVGRECWEERRDFRAADCLSLSCAAHLELMRFDAFDLHMIPQEEFEPCLLGSEFVGATGKGYLSIAKRYLALGEISKAGAMFAMDKTFSTNLTEGGMLALATLILDGNCHEAMAGFYFNRDSFHIPENMFGSLLGLFARHCQTSLGEELDRFNTELSIALDVPECETIELGEQAQDSLFDVMIRGKDGILYKNAASDCVVRPVDSKSLVRRMIVNLGKDMTEKQQLTLEGTYVYMLGFDPLDHDDVLMKFAPRLLGAQAVLERDPKAKLLVYDHFRKDERYREMLTFVLGSGWDDRAFFYNPSRMVLNCANEVIIPEMLGESLTPENINDLRGLFLGGTQKTGEAKVAFVHQSSVFNRFGDKLDTLIEQLGAAFPDKVVVVDTAKMPLEKQRKALKNAGVVIGPSGEGLTSMLFAPRGAQVIAFSSGKEADVKYQNIATYAGLDFVFAHKISAPSMYASYELTDQNISALLARAKSLLERYSRGAASRTCVGEQCSFR